MEGNTQMKPNKGMEGNQTISKLLLREIIHGLTIQGWIIKIMFSEII